MEVLRLGIGSWGEVRALPSVLDFLMDLDPSQRKVVGKMMALLRGFVPEQGPPSHNKQQSNVLEDGLFEFKVGQVRVLYFYDEEERAVVVCTHAFFKRTQTTPKREIKRAKRVRGEYNDARSKGMLRIVVLEGEEELP